MAAIPYGDITYVKILTPPGQPREFELELEVSEFELERDEVSVPEPPCGDADGVISCCWAPPVLGVDMILWELPSSTPGSCGEFVVVISNTVSPSVFGASSGFGAAGVPDMTASPFCPN